jgi:type IV pilus assembly protein PilY1
VAKIDNATMTPTLTTNGAADDEGCYLELATNGEKVVNAPFSIAGATYFGTNRPAPASSTTCKADLGEAYAYKFPLFCGAPTKPNSIAGGGLPPSPVGGIVTLNVNGQDVKMPFIIGSGEGNSSFKPGEPKPPIPPVRTRQHWRIDNTNR